VVRIASKLTAARSAAVARPVAPVHSKNLIQPDCPRHDDQFGRHVRVNGHEELASGSEAQPRASGPPAEHDQLVAKGQIYCNEIGFLGEQGPEDSPDDSEQEHRHLERELRDPPALPGDTDSSDIGIGAGVYPGWFKCQNLKVGRGFCHGWLRRGR
jgi:hypothetical protein